MEMTSMKMSAMEQKEMGESISVDRPEYPYGLCIHLNEEDIAKLGIELPGAGSRMAIHAMADVRDVSVSDDAEHGKQRRMSLQITDLSMMPAKEKEDPSQKLYGEKSPLQTGGVPASGSYL